MQTGHLYVRVSHSCTCSALHILCALCNCRAPSSPGYYFPPLRFFGLLPRASSRSPSWSALAGSLSMGDHRRELFLSNPRARVRLRERIECRCCRIEGLGQPGGERERESERGSTPFSLAGCARFIRQFQEVNNKRLCLAPFKCSPVAMRK
jgi:hypothetical protein